jgi:hypothetical protein
MFLLTKEETDALQCSLSTGIGAAAAVLPSRGAGHDRRALSFLILRGAFNGLKHFEEFQSTLGIARNILSNRLVRMVEHGILERQPDAADRRKVSYRPDRKGPRPAAGAAVAAAMGRALDLRRSEQPGAGRPPAPRQPIADMAPRAADGRLLKLGEMEWVDRSELDALVERAA